jgi:hypothetical protein
MGDYRAVSMSSGAADGSSMRGRAGPDLHLIKQVEQVTNLALED